MTVSRALRGHPSIPEKTRKRICKVAERLGYRPDPAVSQLMMRLRTSRTSEPEIIAWLTCGATPKEWRLMRSSVAIHEGACRRAGHLGYQLEEFCLNEKALSAARLGGILHARGIRGVLVAPLPTPKRTLDFPWEHFAVATCGYSLRTPNLHRACSHQFHAVQVAWNTLRARGYRRIGMALSVHGDARVDGMWRAGFLLPQSELPAEERVPVLLTSQWDAATVNAWFLTHRPDAVITFLDALGFIRQLGLSAPRDFGFVGFNHEDCALCASIDHHMPELGAAAIDLIVEQMQTHQTGIPRVPKVAMVECEWREGNTVRAQETLR